MSHPVNVSRADVIAEARKWLGVRWVHQGRNEAGIDCAGLLIMVGEALGLPAEDMQGYKRHPDGNTFRDHIFSQTVYAPAPAPGVIGLFREARFPTHTGIFAMRGEVLTLIHAHMPDGKVIEEPFAFEWPRLLVSTRDFIGLID